MDFKQFYKTINFDIDNEIRTVFQATQGDTKSRGLLVDLIVGGVKTPVTTEKMTFYALKPDGTRVMTVGVKEGTGFRIDFTNQTFAVPGVLLCTLVLSGTNGEKIADKKFKMTVDSSLEDGAIISEDERGIIDRAFEFATDIVPRLEGLDVPLLENLDSEIILARGTEPTLGARLDADKAEVSAQLAEKAKSLTYNNYAWNGKPDTADYWRFLVSTGAVDTTAKEVRFTPTERLGQVIHNAVQVSGINMKNKLYVRFAIKWAGTGVRDQIGVVVYYNGETTVTQYINGVTGGYQYFSLIFPAVTHAIDRPLVKIVDYNYDSYAEISVKELMILDLTTQFGAGLEPTAVEMDSKISDLEITYFDKSYNTGIAKKAEIATLAEGLTNPPSFSKPLYVSYVDGELRVISKYSDTKDILFILGKKGVNNIFDFKEVKLIDNTSVNVSEDVNAGMSYAVFNSDSFSPHVVRSTDNGDGDKPTSYDFTGGNHGYDNTGGTVGNSATGRTSAVSLKVEGRKLAMYDGLANFIEISWTNMIQGSNTKKVDGMGREILKETYRMIFDGIKWSVEYASEALENIEYTTFYGLQFQTSYWKGGILYHTSPNKVWNVNNGVASDSGDSDNKKCNRMTVRNEALTDFVDIDVDTTFGIGNRELVAAAVPSMFQTDYHKCYCNLVKDKSLPVNTVLTFKGGYKFYSA